MDMPAPWSSRVTAFQVRVIRDVVDPSPWNDPTLPVTASPVGAAGVLATVATGVTANSAVKSLTAPLTARARTLTYRSTSGSHPYTCISDTGTVAYRVDSSDP